MIKHLLLAALCLATFTAVRAGTLQLTVTDAEGQPATDVVVLVMLPGRSAPVPAAGPVVIAQEKLRFAPFLSVVPAGSTLRFVNRDSYDHHVRSTPSGPLGAIPAVTSFELRLDAVTVAGETAKRSNRVKSGVTSADVVVGAAGPIGLGCHLHSSMRGQVYVSDTPWFGKTDANGVVSIDGVPAGAAEVRLWHPDQLQDQPSVRLQIAPTPTTASGQLNFTPRRRRA